MALYKSIYLYLLTYFFRKRSYVQLLPRYVNLPTFSISVPSNEIFVSIVLLSVAIVIVIAITAGCILCTVIRNDVHPDDV